MFHRSSSTDNYQVFAIWRKVQIWQMQLDKNIFSPGSVMPKNISRPQSLQAGLKYTWKSPFIAIWRNKGSSECKMNIITHGEDKLSPPMRDELTNLAWIYCQDCGPTDIIKPAGIEHHKTRQ